ncbi:TPR-like protein [Fomitiporia mediterranea MF3/22]|uniref:TPR-like protein n=1 Tax=Fomitiporia mediterranea (strain MF3/22) TaxID=694068 RepID=UPI0004408581|nr:TPR-like protein [Fomitiporia mediterranea MF3/22]EJD04542.1 TPR-like protein [Fomitiporia mediterranea MF3/22]
MSVSLRNEQQKYLFKGAAVVLHHGNLARSLFSHFEQSGERRDLDSAIGHNRIAIDLLPEVHPTRAFLFECLGRSYFARYERWGQESDYKDAIEKLRIALGCCSDQDFSYRHKLLDRLGRFLQVRFERKKRQEDLEESITLYREALATLPESDSFRPIMAIDLGYSLCRKFDQYGDVPALEEAISVLRATLSLMAEDHPQRLLLLGNMAGALQHRFRYSCGGKVEDLEESITLLRAALALVTDDDPSRSNLLDKLAYCLNGRYELVGRIEDLDEAISMYRVALSLLPQGHPHRHETLNNLANALVAQSPRSNQVEILNEFIELHREALKLRSEGNPVRPASLVNLANALRHRFEHVGELGDLDESIALLREVLPLAPGDSILRPTVLGNLSRSLSTRFDRVKRLEDLEEAITHYRSSLALLVEDRPDYVKVLTLLARSLKARFDQLEQVEDITEAIKLFKCAADHLFSGSLIRLMVASEWVELARDHDHPSTLRAYRKAISLLQRTLTLHPTARMQHSLLANLSSYQTLALDAASYAIEKGDLCQAIELLEQGRAILWSQMRNFRTPLDRLAETSKPLADRFGDVSRRLEALTTHSEANDLLESVPDKQVHCSIDEMLVTVRQLSEEQREIISEIRQLQGFEDFLQATPFEKLQQAASEGPVVVVNLCKEYISHAIIVLNNKDKPCVPIPLDPDFYFGVYTLLVALLRARRDHGVHSVEYDRKLRRVMAMLWDKVVSKVVQKLKEIGIAEGSRIWWCPTSLLSAFPFHAAGPYEDQYGNKKYLLDDYISSHTPTLKSLINARQGTRRENPRLLVIGDTGLPSTKKEMIAIHARKPINKLLRDGKASREAVIKALQEAEWVHFACHGHLDPEPFNSSFKLASGGLTVLDIARTHLPNAESAFLSACHTAEQSPAVAQDEVLHLAAAMQFCGFRSVIGTMWELLDTDGPILTRDIYKYLMDEFEEEAVGFKRSAAAVRNAAVNLKARTESDAEGREVDIKVERWVNLVHIGA